MVSPAGSECPLRAPAGVEEWDDSRASACKIVVVATSGRPTITTDGPVYLE